MTHHSDATREVTFADNHVRLRGPADLADALPYLMGYHPDDSIVLIGLHGPRGRLGGRIRTGIPADPESWAEASEQLAACLAEGAGARGGRPDTAVIYLCEDPDDGGRARDTMERLRPLAQRLRTACGTRDIPVLEALYVSRGRFWSYCCPGSSCCTDEGTELPRAGTSPMAAAAAYAGIQVQGSLKELERRLAPLPDPVARRQAAALDEAARVLLPRMLGTEPQGAAVRAETLELAGRLLGRLRLAPEPEDSSEASRDARDDALLTSEDAAHLLLGLQDRVARDTAAEWMEGSDGQPALRLWRALARRCVGAYQCYAAAPLTLAGWVCWAGGDDTGARVALGRALEAEPEYVFARLLHQALNEGISPEPLRRCMRQQRAARGL